MCYTVSMSYDVKFREKALAYLRAGHSYQETSSVFGISPNTLNAWDKQEKRTGTLERKYRSYSTKVTEESLQAYLADKPDAYQHEMARHFGCAQSTIGSALKRLKITRKKR